MSSHTLNRRWTSADGEKVGLWISLGILSSILFFGLIISFSNIALGDPLRKWRDMQHSLKVKDNIVDPLRARIAALNTSNQEQSRTINDLNSRTGSQGNRIEALLLQLDSLRRDQTAATERSASLDSELQRIKPRVAQLDDEVKVLRREKNAALAERDEAREKIKDMSKRLAFVTSKIAEES